GATGVDAAAYLHFVSRFHPARYGMDVPVHLGPVAQGDLAFRRGVAMNVDVVVGFQRAVTAGHVTGNGGVDVQVDIVPYRDIPGNLHPIAVAACGEATIGYAHPGAYRAITESYVATRGSKAAAHGVVAAQRNVAPRRDTARKLIVVGVGADGTAGNQVAAHVAVLLQGNVG